MKHIRYLTILLLILGMLNSCKEKEPQAPWEQERPQTEATQATPDADSPSDIPAEAPQQRDDIYTVIRIVDGDTFVAEKDGVSVRVRLMGVDTPESVHPDKEVEYFALEASAFLKTILQDEEIYFTFDQNNAATNHTDRYGRLLAYAHRLRDGLLINTHLIKEGYGYAYLKYPFEHMEEYLELQRGAREAGKGLWKDSGTSAASQKEYWFNAGSNKYHLKSCRFTKKSSMPIPLADALANGLEPCKVCKPK